MDGYTVYNFLSCVIYCIIQLMYSQTSKSKRMVVHKAKVAFYEPLTTCAFSPGHDTKLGMQQNSRSIATAVSLFICSYDMWA